jgi:hypothetical protein
LFFSEEKNQKTFISRSPCNRIIGPRTMHRRQASHRAENCLPVLPRAAAQKAAPRRPHN